MKYFPQQASRRSAYTTTSTPFSMTSAVSALFKRGVLRITGSDHGDGSFTKAPEGKLFTKVDPAVDGEDCDHDCATCTIKYPSKFSIDEKEELYGLVKGWSTHLLVATGKSDWVRDVEDEKGSVMEAIGKAKKPDNGVSYPFIILATFIFDLSSILGCSH
jgi:hypothetical protein